MFNSKKILALCATTVASLSTFGALSQVAFADVPKAGDTIVTFDDTTPTPAEWGLSVPANMKLDKISSVDGSNIHYGNMKIGIVDTQGQNLVDATKDRVFSVSGKGTGTNGNLSFTDKSGQKHDDFLFATATTNQGDAEPTEMTKTAWDDASNDATKLVSEFETKADGSNAKTEKWIQFGVDEAKSGFDKNDTYNETISWTATEK